MAQRVPNIFVTSPDGDTEENVIRSSRQMMVPELRASVRERVSNLRPGGLPLPGKTTQGFRASQRSSSRESAQPKSFRTVRNFWRRLEERPEDTAPPPRRFAPPKRIIPEEPSSTGFKMPVLRKVPNARESARRKSSKKPSVKAPTKEEKRVSLESPVKEGKTSLKSSSITDHKKSSLRVPSTKGIKTSSLKTSITEGKRSKLESPSIRGNEGNRKPSIKPMKIPSIRTITSREDSVKAKPPGRSTIPTQSTIAPGHERIGKKLSSEGSYLKVKAAAEEVEEDEAGEGEGDEVGEGEGDEAGEREGEEADEEDPDLDEEMEEEEEVDEDDSPPVVNTRRISDAAVSPPTADMRPSSLWAALPRMFSDESMGRPSVILPVLLEEEKLFHELVAGGDVSAVSDFLSKRPDFNINCENYQGISALHIAVKDDNEDMVQYLLSLPAIEVRDSHLFAIRDNHPGILVMILDKLQSINPALEFMACSNSPEFAENITPLILAAEAGHFDIVGLLVSRGHVIPRPHKPRCFCREECQAIMKSQDMLSISSGKLHIYRALSNPAYICQNTPDPLLVAFKLSKELLTCGHVDTIYLRQYEALAESLRTFAVEIIAECRTLEEVETILSENRGSNLKGDWTYPRLILAMDYKQKEFIAHPNVQQVLERAWMGDWIAWRGFRVYIKALYVIPRLVTLPMVLVVLMFTPTSKWAKHFSLPVNKLLSNVASYCIFLLLVFIQSNVTKKHQTRDTKPTGVEIFLVIYVLTFIYNSIRSLLKQGFHRFFKFMWNIYELVMELFFIMAFIFLIAAEIKTTIVGDKDLERKYWNYLDPELISESFFVLAAIMAYMRILLIFQISYHLGPLQVSLGKMTNDCAMFSVIFAIIIIAFTAGLCKFYSYYEDMVQTNPETGEVESTQVNSFTGVLDTFKTLFWGLFGMSSFDVADVIVENVEEGGSNSTTTNEHHLTEAVGYFAFATYMILTVIVILNMLIATMSNTFQKVTDNVDTEWLFGRTEVYMSYIDLPVLPPPFNVIPTTHGLVNLIKGHKVKAGNLIGVDVEKGTVEEPDDKKNDDYYILMSQLVQRYFSTKSSEND